MNDVRSVIVDRLILVGHRKNYVVNFYSGVNIIYGDSTTGKSSILELINFAFGASKFIYDQEIETSVKYIALEVKLNKNRFLIQRDIFRPRDLVEVYACDFEEKAKFFPKRYSPNFDSEGPDGYLSDFLLTELDLPIIKVRQAPTQAESAMVRLSFRDLFKYCYLKQDDVGSKQLLDASNYAKAIKNKQTFKYIFNLLDTNISGLEGELQSLLAERNRLQRKFESVSDFLRETGFETSINLADSSEDLERQANILTDELRSVNESIIANNESYDFLKAASNSFASQIVTKNNERSGSDVAIERFARLKNDYNNDIEKLKSIEVASRAIGQPLSDLFACPICDTQVDLTKIKAIYNIDENDKANQESNAISRRIRDLDNLIQSERDLHQTLSAEIAVLNQDQSRARRLLDEELGSMISPYLSQRDGLSSELATVNERLRQVEHSVRVRNQQNSIRDEVERMEDRATKLTEQLQGLRINAPSIDAIVASLADILNSYLSVVNIKDRRDVSISRTTYLPNLRRRDYIDITSGGLRTILSIGYLISLFEYSLHNNVNLPAFLMVDTVGKYLGKTQIRYSDTVNSEDEKENISDPSKYNNMYEYMIMLADKAAAAGEDCQIILVDNDVPVNIQKKYAGFIVAQYSSNGENGLPYGLIDDAHFYR
jgi:hypothetical protein